MKFLKSVRYMIETFRRSFVFTDKDMGQTNAIREVFNVIPALCFWHFKSAIKTKIGNVRKTVLKLNYDHEGKLYKFVDIRFFGALRKIVLRKLTCVKNRKMNCKNFSFGTATLLFNNICRHSDMLRSIGKHEVEK